MLGFGDVAERRDKVWRLIAVFLPHSDAFEVSAVDELKTNLSRRCVLYKPQVMYSTWHNGFSLEGSVKRNSEKKWQRGDHLVRPSMTRYKVIINYYRQSLLSFGTVHREHKDGVFSNCATSEDEKNLRLWVPALVKSTLKQWARWRWVCRPPSSTGCQCGLVCCRLRAISH